MCAPAVLKIDAYPLFRRGDFAVWDTVDIPVGVRRCLIAFDVDAAFNNVYAQVVQTEEDQRWARIRRNAGVDPPLAAVSWADLQPLHDVPRGRESMTAAQWGATRDAAGTCLICEADDSMACDTVAHEQDARPLIKPLFKRDDVVTRPGAGTTQIGIHPAMIRSNSTAAPWGAWMPGTEGGVVDAPTAARIGVAPGLQVRFRRYADNAAVAQDVWRASDGVRVAGCVAVRGLRGSAATSSASETTAPSPGAMARLLVHMSAASGEDVDRSGLTAEARDIWAAALRERVQASAQRERNQVLVDLEFEPWE